MLVVGVRVAESRMYVGPRWREAIELFLTELSKDETVFAKRPVIEFFDSLKSRVVVSVINDSYSVSGKWRGCEFESGLSIVVDSRNRKDVEDGFRQLFAHGRSFQIVFLVEGQKNCAIYFKVHENGSELIIGARDFPSDFRVKDNVLPFRR